MQTCGVMEVDGDLPRRIQTSSGGVLVNYCYLSDGSKAEAVKADGTGLVYRGSLIYRKAANGTLTLESAPAPTGRLAPDGVRYHVTDHLGSVVAIVDGSTGALYQASEYAPYGERTDNAAVTVSSAPAGETFRDHFTGKEDQGPDFTVPYTDFGARHYSPALSRWLAPDPLSEKYYDVSPYVYCDGTPVMMVDEDGRFPDIIWDIANILIDISSLWDNIEEGNTKEALIDGGGLAIDVLAAVVPFVPGGAGTAIKSARIGEKTVDAVKSVEKVATKGKPRLLRVSTGHPGVPSEGTLLEIPKGYRQVKGTSHGQKVFTNGKDFISPDIDEHHVAGWKKAKKEKTYSVNKPAQAHMIRILKKIMTENDY